MSSSGEYAKLAKKILEEYYHGFQERNPTLRVFSAHLHMDEATPHLHIDFVPFTTNSKQGLETRVSLKKALSSLGFTGGTRSETEWNQWIAHEKTVLAEVMERNGITWLKKGTHEKHLSVLEYEKKMRTQEVEELENNISKLTTEEQAIKTNLEELKKSEALLELNVKKYDTDKEWLLPEPAPMVSVKNYIEKKVKPFVEKLKNVIKSLVYQYLELKKSYDSLNTAYWKVKSDYHAIEGRLYELGEENKDLRKITNEYRLLRKSIGEEKVTEILNKSSGRKQKAKDTFSK